MPEEPRARAPREARQMALAASASIVRRAGAGSNRGAFRSWRSAAERRPSASAASATTSGGGMRSSSGPRPGPCSGVP
ncbi:hypothetical protein MRX96_000651 [Rhipicephalus microplus]